jgi:hypothetical protein
VPALLIDDHGRISEVPSFSLQRQSNTPVASADQYEFVLFNLGFIGLTMTGDDVRVRLRPDVVNKVALGALCFWLHEHPRRSITLTWHDGRWHDEVIQWNHSGWRRVISVLENSKAHGQRFSRERTSPNALGSKNPLLTLFKSWSANDFENSRDILRQVNDRFVLVEEDADHELRICQVGRTMMARSPAWKKNAIGLRVDDLPDWRYGQWVAEAYREVARNGRPLIEKVVASIEWEECGLLSHCYWRVILPWKERGVPTLLLGATLDCTASAS